MRNSAGEIERLLTLYFAYCHSQIVKHSNGDAWVEAQGKPYSPQQIGAVSADCITGDEHYRD